MIAQLKHKALRSIHFLSASNSWTFRHCNHDVGLSAVHQDLKSKLIYTANIPIKLAGRYHAMESPAWRQPVYLA